MLGVIAILGWGGYLIELNQEPEVVPAEIAVSEQIAESAGEADARNWESEYAQLAQELESLRVENTGLRNLNEELDRRVSELPSDTDSALVHDLKAAVEKLEKQEMALRAEIEQIEQARQETVETDSSDQPADIAKSSDSDLWKARYLELRGKFEVLQPESRQLKVLNEELQIRIDELLDELDGAQSHTVAELKQTMDNLATKSEMLEGKIASLKQEQYEDNQDATASVAVNGAQGAEQSSSTQSAQDGGDSDSDIAPEQWKGKYLALKAEFDKLRTQSTQLKELNSELDQRIRELIAEQIATDSATTDELQHTVSELRSKTQSLEQELANGVTDETSAVVAYKAVHDNPDYLRQRLMQARTQLRRNRASVQRHKSESQQLLKALGLQIARAEENRVRLNSQLKTTEEANTLLFEANSALRQRIDQINIELGQLAPRVVEQRQLLTEKERAIQETEQQLAEKEQRLAELRESIRVLEDEHSQQLTSFELQIREIRDDLHVVTVANDILFDSGSPELTDDGRNALTLIFDKLIAQSNRLISLEGHTDTVPITGSLSGVYPTNWELSAARATTAARFLIAKGLPAQRVRAVAFGETKPIASNDTEFGKARNRRLEIHLLPPLETISDTQN